MAVSDVKVSVDGNLPISPIGVEIVYAVNTVPYCVVQMDATRSASLLADPDSFKRQGLVNVNLSVKDKTIKFIGLFDGLSASQSVGGINYEAILKGQAQLLLECDTIIPGLSPYGVDPFHATKTDAFSQTSDDQTKIYEGLEQGALSINFDGLSLPEAYKAMAISAVTYQTTPGAYSSLVPQAPNLDGTTLKDVMENPGRIAKLQSTITLLNNLDVTALAALKNVVFTSDTPVANNFIHSYVTGPRILWENLIEYYGMLGAIFIPANTKILVVPNNGFITFPHSIPGTRQHSSIPNAAYPADDNFFNYNDNGYRDVGYVALVAQLQASTGSVHSFAAYQGGYPKKGGNSLAAGAGLLVIESNPLMLSAAAGYFDPTTNSENAKDHTSEKTTNVPSIQKINNFATQQSDPESLAKKSSADYSARVLAFGDNYAEIKFYQARYGDRTGSITLQFNPNWCPGTVGTLYAREPGIFLDFFVQRVSHRVALSAPNTGIATTTVDFNCGRIGTTTASVAEDKLYNYGYGDVLNVQNQFISDIT